MSPMIVYSISHTVAFLSEALDPSAHPHPPKKNWNRRLFVEIVLIT